MVDFLNFDNLEGFPVWDCWFCLFCSIWFVLVWFVLIWLSEVRFGLVDLVWFDMVWYGQCFFVCNFLFRCFHSFLFNSISYLPFPKPLPLTKPQFSHAQCHPKIQKHAPTLLFQETEDGDGNQTPTIDLLDSFEGERKKGKEKKEKKK